VRRRRRTKQWQTPRSFYVSARFTFSGSACSGPRCTSQGNRCRRTGLTSRRPLPFPLSPSSSCSKRPAAIVSFPSLSAAAIRLGATPKTLSRCPAPASPSFRSTLKEGRFCLCLERDCLMRAVVEAICARVGERGRGEGGAYGGARSGLQQGARTQGRGVSTSQRSLFAGCQKEHGQIQQIPKYN
jgi:hypothetical protein